MKERKNFWDRNAGRYDRFMRKDGAAYEEMYELIRPVVKDKTVLELATGTGLIAKNIVNAAAHIEATDASTDMIVEARRDNRSAKLHFSVHCRHRDSRTVLFGIYCGGEGISQTYRFYRRRIVCKLFYNRFFKVLSVYRKLKGYVSLSVCAALDFNPKLRLIRFAERTYKQVGDVYGRTNINVYVFVQSHSGRAVMPSCPGVVPSYSGRGIHLFAFVAFSVFPLASHENIVVFQLDSQCVQTTVYILCDFKFKWRKKAFMYSDAYSVYVYMRDIVGSADADINRVISVRLFRCE